jgi:hypothetical protein
MQYNTNPTHPNPNTNNIINSKFSNKILIIIIKITIWYPQKQPIRILSNYPINSIKYRIIYKIYKELSIEIIENWFNKTDL